MATNAELERQVVELRKELATLREVLDKTFRSAGLGSDWASAHARTVTSVEIAAQVYEDRPPTPVSAVPTLADFQDMSQELFGTRDLTMTPERIEQLKKQFGGKE
jgi:hypothetical protein